MTYDQALKEAKSDPWAIAKGFVITVDDNGNYDWKIVGTGRKQGEVVAQYAHSMAGWKKLKTNVHEEY